MGGRTRRVAVAAVLALALTPAAAGCAETVTGRASPAETAPLPLPAPVPAPSTAPLPAPAPAPTPLPAPAPVPAPAQVDEFALCLGVGLGLVGPNQAWLDWLAAVDAGQAPPVSAEEVAAGYDAAVADLRPLVDGATPGAPRDAAQALLATATALAADLRAGGRGTDVGLVPASDALDAACPD